VQAVVVREKNAPATVETIIVPEPGPGEVVVDVLTCGVCHTDYHYQQGGISDDFPFLLGHESTARVAVVGEGVTEVAVGDRVILNWRAVCGQCRACAKGQPQYCFNTHNATQKMTLEDGTELSPALGIGSFAEKTLVAAGQCTKIDEESDAAAVGLVLGEQRVLVTDHLELDPIGPERLTGQLGGQDRLGRGEASSRVR